MYMNKLLFHCRWGYWSQYTSVSIQYDDFVFDWTLLLYIIFLSWLK